MEYTEILKDPRWQKKRLKIMERDEFTCRHCLSSDKTLHVHHIKYYGNPWEIDDKFLITLCDDCHEYEEELKSFDIYNELKELGITKFQANILIKSIADRYRLIGNVDFMSWFDTVNQVFKNG